MEGELSSDVATVEASLSLGALAPLHPGGVSPIIDVSAGPSEHFMARAPGGGRCDCVTATSPLSTWRATLLEP